MKKKIIIVNVVIFFFLFFLVDFFVCYFEMKKINYSENIFEFYIKNKTEKLGNVNLAKNVIVSSYNDRRERVDAYGKAKNISPIIFTGCSYMYGVGLSENQTLPYKISQIMQRPVYNFGIPSGGLSQLLFSIETGLFDKWTKENTSSLSPVLIMYLYGDFHILRLIMSNTFFEPQLFLYKIEKGKLVRKTAPFFIKRFPLLYVINEKLFLFLLRYSNQYKSYVKELLKLHFYQIRENLRLKYPNIKFVILNYEISPIFEEIIEDLERDDFIIFDIKEDFSIDVGKDTYFLEDGHPSEKVWNEVAPLLAKRFERILSK